LLHTFTAPPAFPDGGLIQVPDGSFYGVTRNAIIRWSTGGQVTEVSRLAVARPTGGLVRASEGALYGTTSDLGPAARDSVFRFDPATGAFRTLQVFDSLTEGRGPLGSLVEVGGSLYGITAEGPGFNRKGTIFHVVVATGAVVTDLSAGRYGVLVERHVCAALSWCRRASKCGKVSPFVGRPPLRPFSRASRKDC
jgi:hypothetical protein